MRLHSGPKTRFRYPWAFGQEALEITRDYVKLRYRLLPVFYAAARRAFEDGTPLLRKLSEEWPEHPEAAAWDQVILGEDILFAPVLYSVDDPEHLTEPLTLPDGFSREMFENNEFDGEPLHTAVDECVCLDPQNIGEFKSVVGGEIAGIRWAGTFVAPERACYKFVLSGNGAKQLHVKEDAYPEIRHLFDIGLMEASRYLEAGESVRLRVLARGSTNCRLAMRKLAPTSDLQPVSRRVWLPPGHWRNAWTGETVEGPKTVTVTAALRQTPMFIRCGGIVPVAPDMNYTDEKKWSPLAVDFHAPVDDGETVRWLYEDDGRSMGYDHGEHRKTPLWLRRQGDTLSVRIGPAAGTFPGCLDQRTWICRIWLAPGESPDSVTVDGQPVEWTRLEPDAESDTAAMPFQGADAPPSPKAGPIVQVTASCAAEAESHVDLTMHRKRII